MASLLHMRSRLHLDRRAAGAFQGRRVLFSTGAARWARQKPPIHC